MTPASNSFLWNSLVAFTILAGAAVTVLILNKERYLPGLYAGHSDHEAHVEEAQKEGAHKEAVHKEEAKEHEPAATPAPLARHEDTGTKAATPVDPQQDALKDDEYVLVGGSFLSEEYARKYQSLLKENNLEIYPQVVPITQSETTYYRVVVLHSEDRLRVLAVKKQLSEAGKESWLYRQ